MTTPNQVEPTREQVALKSAIRLLESVGAATGGVLEELLAAELNAFAVRETATLTQQLTAASERINGLVEMCNRAEANDATLRARILELESQCGEKDLAIQALIDAAKHDGEGAKRALACVQGREALTTTGNTLVERVKGLEKVAQRFLNEFSPDHCECKEGSPLMDGKAECDYCFARKFITSTPKASHE